MPLQSVQTTSRCIMIYPLATQHSHGNRTASIHLPIFTDQNGWSSIIKCEIQWPEGMKKYCSPLVSHDSWMCHMYIYIFIYIYISPQNPRNISCPDFVATCNLQRPITVDIMKLWITFFHRCLTTKCSLNIYESCNFLQLAMEISMTWGLKKTLRLW